MSATPNTSRCTNYKAPPIANGVQGGQFTAVEYWAGNHLVLSGRKGAGEILKRGASTPAPNDGQSYPLMTKDGAVFRCLNIGANEFFEAVTPDGTRYRFDNMVSRPTTQLTKPNPEPELLTAQNQAGGITPLVAIDYFVNRSEVWILPTVVTDRFGNTVTYNWDSTDRWKLLSINASDGRQLTLTYVSGTRRIYSVSDGTRQWIYDYSAVSGGEPRLSRVTLPDSSQWTFELQGMRDVMRETGGGCGATTSDPASGTGTMTHPSGAQGSFAVAATLHGRSYVPSQCVNGYSYYPAWFATPSLASKTITGPGISAMSWSYVFAENSCYLPCASGAPASKTLTVTGPGGVTRYTFGNMFRNNEGQLLKVEDGLSGGTALRTTDNTYAPADAGPWPYPIGSSIQPRGAGIMNQWYQPLATRTITQQGRTFTWQVPSNCSGMLCFDTFARPTKVTRASSSGHTRTDVTSYYDHLGKWVLGQIWSVTNSDTGLVQSNADYDPITGVPTDIYAFGKKQQTLAYNSDGTLYTAMDGGNHATTLASWKRGIPQLITYSDNTTKSAVVNDLGWITSVTDQNSFTTSYAHDSMGRLSRITYPSADDIAWNPKSWVFEQVTSSEYGLSSGHWRQTESTGNARKISYFDALWRPIVTTEYDIANPGSTQRFQRFGYDHDNRTTFTSYPGTTDALTTGTRTEYDTLGRTRFLKQDSERGLLTTQTEYLGGFQVRVTNPRNYVTVTDYRTYDEPTYDLVTSIQLPEGAYTDISHDIFGKPLSITRRDSTSSKSITRRYVYDGYQQLCKSIEPETGATVMEYDGAGNLVWSASGLNLTNTSSCDRSTALASGRAVSRSYDALNRLYTLSFPDANGDQTWIYTADGLPDTITTFNAPGSSAITNHYDYNKRRLLKSETLSQSGWSARTIGYGYDANGNQSTVTYPSSLAVNYAPNALGQATQAGSYASGVSYYPNGAIHQFTYGNNIVHTMTQNARQLPDQVTDQLPDQVTDSGNVINNTYTYDNNANVQQISDAITANNTRVMGYDGLDRLTSTLSASFGGNGDLQYRYDELDNLKSAKLGGLKQYNYGYDATTNRLTSITNDTGTSIFGLSYDPQGNVSSKNAQGFTFDYGNRLRESDASGALVESYEYDAYGRRVNALSPTNGNIRSVYGSDGVLRHQIDERTAKAIDYIYLGGSLVARVSTSIPPAVPKLTSPPSTAPSASYLVQWTSQATATSYELQQSYNSGAWTNVYSGAGLSLSLSSKPAGRYGYRVRACSSQGCSAWSDTRRVTVPPAPTTAPTLSAPTTGANGSYTVSWTGISDTTSYQLEESFNSGAWTSAYTGSLRTVAYASKTAGTYTYRVKACNGVGCGPLSATRAVTVVYAPSTAPTITTPAQSTTGSYTVSWTSITGAASYRLEERFNSGSWTQIQDSSATSRAMTAKPAGVYSYRAYACNAAGCSAVSATKSTEVVSSLGVPTLSTPASSSTGSYTVSWTSVTSATSYQLEESSNAGSTWTQIQNAASTSASISGRTTGTYVYRARACTSTCGGVSNSGTTQVLLVPAAPSTPSSPANNTTGSYTVSWGTVATATSYRLEESVNSGSWSEIFNAGGTSASLAGRTTATYSYRARACNASGCGGYSGAATTQVLLAPTGVPSISVPTSSYNGSYSVDWSSIQNASSYRLEESANGGAWTEIQNSASTSLGLSGKASGAYSYRVRGCNTTGCGSYSSTATVQVTLPPATPSLSVPASSTNGSYTVSWTAISGAASYSLEENANGAGWTQIQNAASTSMAFAGRGDGTYGYRVRACNVAGCSGYSAEPSITVLLVPTVPSSLSVTVRLQNGKYNHTATWSSSSTATSYEFTGGRNYTGPNRTYSWLEPDISDAACYVRACNASGCSALRGPVYPQLQ